VALLSHPLQIFAEPKSKTGQLTKKKENFCILKDQKLNKFKGIEYTYLSSLRSVHKLFNISVEGTFSCIFIVSVVRNM
jgi:hypothetical protein